MKLLLLLLCLGISVLAEPGKFWMEDIGHYGRSPYHPDSNYQVFRNVKDFGAVGNGRKTTPFHFAQRRHSL